LNGWVTPDLVDLYFNYYGTELLAYARTGAPWEASDAWTTALDGIRAPIDPSVLASRPYYGQGADAISAWVYRELYLAPSGLNTTPVSDPAVLSQVANDGKNILTNLDGVRSYATRRVVVDALKRAQNNDAFLALTAARATIQANLWTLSPVDQALTRDLLARIDAAMAPYFE
jgi:hypothetical protein